jgi:hypothetical protein
VYHSPVGNWVFPDETSPDQTVVPDVLVHRLGGSHQVSDLSKGEMSADSGADAQLKEDFEVHVCSLKIWTMTIS